MDCALRASGLSKNENGRAAVAEYSVCVVRTLPRVGVGVSNVKVRDVRELGLCLKAGEIWTLMYRETNWESFLSAWLSVGYNEGRPCCSVASPAAMHLPWSSPTASWAWDDEILRTESVPNCLA